MRDALSPDKPSGASEVVLEALERLWQTKLRCVVFLERWLQETTDVEIRVGLETQLIDERRHARLLAEEIRRQRQKPLQAMRQPAVRPFREFGPIEGDLHKLCAIHRGIKAFNLNRCGHLIPLVESRLARILEQIAREEERHIRWADIRLARLLTHDEMRACNTLMSLVWTNMETSWEKTWHDLMRIQRDPARLTR